jgi:arylsulfatase A-like enzyme
LKAFATSVLKSLWGSFFLITSLYCLLAFLPYTNHMFIQAPPYMWLALFAKYHVLLYWLAVLCAAVGFWPQESRPPYVLLIGAQAVVGVYLIFRPLAVNLHSDRKALIGALAALVPIILMGLWDMGRRLATMRRENLRDFQYRYAPVLYAAVITAVVFFAAGQILVGSARGKFLPSDSDLMILAWSAILLVILGIFAVSALNVMGMMAARMPRPRAARIVLMAVAAAFLVRTLFLRFCAEAFSFEGLAAQVYCALLGAAVVLLVLVLSLPLMAARRDIAGESMILNVRRPLHLGAYVFGGSLCAVALALPTVLGGGDWNGFLEHAYAILFWILFAACVYSLRPVRAKHSLLKIIAIVVLAVASLKALQATEIFWGRSIGKTDDDIARALDRYSARDASFDIAHGLLDTSRAEPCGDMCRIMRQYTNLREVRVNADVTLVDRLEPTTGTKPNIFIFVVDSMRPDYLGAYNTKVTFTPNIDALAHDPNSVAIKNVYTQYAGTSLSEPAIWSGMLMLHAHWMQPFSRLNSLEKLARTDGYKMIMSKDALLSELLDPSDDLIDLDPHKPWNQMEACTTVGNLEAKIDAGAAQGKPIFFYSQPMNVHQFARNNQPRGAASGWRAPVELGFDARVATEVHQVDGCLGSFFDHLHKKGMWDNSIIILTSDHGDATGELGRSSHSLWIYPEIMHVPMIVHLPPALRTANTYDDSHVGSLLDVAPTLYELLGHGPVKENPMFGRPMFVGNPAQERAPRTELFMASDVRAVYGILDENGHYLYVIYDSPAKSELYDLAADPSAQHNIITPAKKREYDLRILGWLQQEAKFYQYQPRTAGFWTP